MLKKIINKIEKHAPVFIFLFSFGTLIFYIMNYHSTILFNSDSATANLLAREQLLT